MQNRHIRALFWTVLIGLFLCGPVSFRIWLDSESGKIAVPRLGEVEPFVYRDQLGAVLTKETLRNGVTIVVNIPRDCGEACAKATQQAHVMESWINDHLTIKHAEEKNPLHLLAAAGGFTPAKDGWQTIVEEPTEGTLLPRGYASNKPWLVVIDPWLVFGGVWDLNQPLDFKSIERVLSRTTFEQYLGNYLARRTFMGPKRDAR